MNRNELSLLSVGYALNSNLPLLNQGNQERLLKGELSLDSAISGTDRHPCGSFNLEKDPALCCLEIFR